MDALISEVMWDHNLLPVDDFEGFTPREMDGLLYAPFDPDRSCMRLNKEVSEKSIKGAYFVKDVKAYLGIVYGVQPLKLTVRGNLPRKFCRDLVSRGLCENDRLWFKEYELMREEDSYYINLLNNYTQLAGLTKKRKKHLSLTRMGEKLLDSSPSDFYLYVFETYCTKINWGCSDRYPYAWIIQGSFPYSIYLMQKYGDKKRSPKFYAQKIIRAFPNSVDEFKEEEWMMNCYSVRVIERFMKRFGLITMKKSKSIDLENYRVRKKGSIDELISWERGTDNRWYIAI